MKIIWKCPNTYAQGVHVPVSAPDFLLDITRFVDAIILRYCLSLSGCTYVLLVLNGSEKEKREPSGRSRGQGNQNGRIFGFRDRDRCLEGFFRSATCPPSQRTNNEKRNVRFSRVTRTTQSGVDSQSVCFIHCFRRL